MKRALLRLLAVMALGVAAVAVPASALAAPALVLSGTNCFVQDANGVQYTDTNCDWHAVLQTDENGKLVLLSYDDHGHLPEGAAVPQTAIQFTVHASCDCPFEGDYAVVLRPDGSETSHGPIDAP